MDGKRGEKTQIKRRRLHHVAAYQPWKGSIGQAKWVVQINFAPKLLLPHPCLYSINNDYFFFEKIPNMHGIEKINMQNSCTNRHDHEHESMIKMY